MWQSGGAQKDPGPFVQFCDYRGRIGLSFGTRGEEREGRGGPVWIDPVRAGLSTGEDGVAPVERGGIATKGTDYFVDRQSARDRIDHGADEEDR